MSAIVKVPILSKLAHLYVYCVRQRLFDQLLSVMALYAHARDLHLHIK